MYKTYINERIAEWNARKDDPMEISRRIVFQTLTQQEPSHYLYKPSIEEDIKLFQSSNVESAKKFYQSFITPKNVTIGVVGDFDPKALKSQLDVIFKGWNSGAQDKFVKIHLPYKPSKGGPIVVSVPDKQMATTAVVQTVDASDESPDYPALELANHILGGGMVQGRLPERLREKEGLSYSVGSVLRANTGDKSAAFIGFAIFAPQNWERVLVGFKEEIEKATRLGFTEDEIKKNKVGLLQQRKVAFSMDYILASGLAEYLTYNRTLMYELNLDLAVEKLNLAEVNAAFRKHINYDSLVRISVGTLPKAEPAK